MGQLKISTPPSKRHAPGKAKKSVQSAIAQKKNKESVVVGLGPRLRQIREDKQLSLRYVARTADISPSLLSKIELESVSPSIISLLAIAEALKVPPGVLLDTEGPPQLIVRRSERRIMDAPFCRREYMMDPQDPTIDACELILPPGGYSRPELARHSGRDYVLVLKGRATIIVDNAEYQLLEGDYASFDGYRPHRVINRSRNPTRVLWFVVLANGASPNLLGRGEHSSAPVKKARRR